MIFAIITVSSFASSGAGVILQMMIESCVLNQSGLGLQTKDALSSISLVS